MLQSFISPEFFSAILRATTPILFAALGASVAAKSGITNMAIEGIMLFAALFGVIFTSITGNFIGGFLLTIVAGGLLGCLLAYLVLKLKTDEILAAIAINMLASGGTVLLMLAYSGDRGSSTSIVSYAAPRINIPLIENIPWLGEVISGQNLMTYLAIIAVIVMHLFLYKTPLGLKIRAVGENKNAAESVGISSQKVQFIALIISGILAALGGFFLSGGYMNMFTKEMQAGKGYIALSASAMGGNSPIGAMLVSFLFGLAQALGNVLQLTDIPHELIQMIPYLTTLFGLAFYSYRNKKKKEKLAAK